MNQRILKNIENVFANWNSENLYSSARTLLQKMGYESNRTITFSGDPKEFVQEFPTDSKPTQTEKEFLASTDSIHLLFQYTKEEIIGSTQSSSLESFDKSNASSFLFFAVQLKESSCTRSKYAKLTREINKRLNIPSIVIFQTGGGY